VETTTRCKLVWTLSGKDEGLLLFIYTIHVYIYISASPSPACVSVRCSPSAIWSANGSANRSGSASPVFTSAIACKQHISPTSMREQASVLRLLRWPARTARRACPPRGLCPHSACVRQHSTRTAPHCTHLAEPEVPRVLCVRDARVQTLLDAHALPRVRAVCGHGLVPRLDELELERLRALRRVCWQAARGRSAGAGRARACTGKVLCQERAACLGDRARRR
jgi:hypothetical protein